MLIRIKNCNLSYAKKPYTSGVLANIKVLNMVYTEDTNNFKIWWYRNTTNRDLSIRIYNANGNKYSSQRPTFVEDNIPTVSDTAHNGGTSTVPKQAYDATVTLPAGKYLLIQEYAFADSGAPIPSVQIDGENVALPTI